MGEKGSYDPGDWGQAFEAAKLNDKIATGVLYKTKQSVPYLSRMPHREQAKTTLVEEVKGFSIKGFIDEFE